MAKQHIYDESRLRPGQRVAAALLAQNEFLPKKERKTLAEIAAEANVSEMTLYRWRTEDENFIGYKNSLASTYMDEHLAFVYGKLLEGVKNGSMKAVELFLKRMGDLDTKTDVTVRQGGDEETHEERVARLRERLEGLDLGKEEENE